MEALEAFVYPYILLDGGHREVVEIRKGTPSVHLGRGAFIQHPDPLTTDGQITEDCRRSLLSAACAFAQSHGGVVSIVWGVHGFSHARVDENGKFRVQTVRLEVAK
jgi:hypothetical protein